MARPSGLSRGRRISVSSHASGVSRVRTPSHHRNCPVPSRGTLRRCIAVDARPLHDEGQSANAWRWSRHTVTVSVKRSGPMGVCRGRAKITSKDYKNTPVVKLTSHRDQKCYLVMPRSRRWAIRSCGQVWTGMDMRVSRLGMHPELLAQ
jgi:hypothetical protein